MSLDDTFVKMINEEKDKEKALEEAYLRSLKRRQEKKIERRSKNLKRATVILTCGVLVVGGFVYGPKVANYVVDVVESFQQDDELKMEQLNKRIGSLVVEYDSDMPLRDRKMNVTILDQCTKRTSDNKGYFYDHGMAVSKILELEPELQEYALCALLNEMGTDRYIKYNGTSTNADSIISYIQTYEKNNERQLIEEGIETLDDYLKYKGYVDKKGEVSFKEYVKAQEENAPIVKEIIDELKESKGLF